MFIPTANAGLLDTLVIPGISISALAMQVWELVIHWSDEVEYLWKGRFNLIKALYFLVRYGLLFAQVASEITSYKMQIEESTVHDCINAFIFKIIIAQLTLTMVEMILYFRVYALYNQSFQVKQFLLISLVTAQILEIWATTRIVSDHLNNDNTDCKPPVAHLGTLVQFGVGASLSQLVIFFSSFYKLLNRRSSRTPLTSLMLKEGLAAFLLILVLLIVMMGHYEVFRSVNRNLGNAAFAWYIALISIGASRLILNMRKLVIKSTRRRQLRHLSLYNEIDRSALAESFYDSDDTICLTSFYE
ncbi:hypothetical protein BJ912DRAFT_1042634 [Pholiota molesta]|nr:hypothetical protein BJ912DRAFT_1042634 [Pholiota molesta]